MQAQRAAIPLLIGSIFFCGMVSPGWKCSDPTTIQAAASQSLDSESAVKSSASDQDPGCALRKIREKGGKIEVDSGQPGAPVVKIMMDAQPASDAVLGLLPLFPSLREVSVRGLEIQDAGLTHLKNLEQLRKLHLNYTQISNEGLALLAGIKTLKELDLSGCIRITDQGVRRLKKMIQLESLDLTFTNVTENGIDELRRALPKLKICCRHEVAPQELANAEAKGEKVLPPPAPEGLQGEMIIKQIDVFKERGDWTGLAAAGDRGLQLPTDSVHLRQIVAWNLSDNLTSGLNDVADCYAWIRQAVMVLLEGVTRRPDEGLYYWDVGWIIAQKIGVGPEARQLRRLFCEDSTLQRLLITGFSQEEVLGPDKKPDNFLVARQWFLKAQDRLARHQSDPSDQHKSPLIFYSHAPMCRFHYAMTIEEEGLFGETARLAWEAAQQEWKDFGSRQIPDYWGKKFRLDELPQLQNKIEVLYKEFDALAPGLREKMRQERLQKLPGEYRRAWEIPPEKRTPDEQKLSRETEIYLLIPPLELAQNVQGDNQLKASQIAKQIDDLENQAERTQIHGEIVNFHYWKQRAAAEQLPSTLRGRQFLDQALQRLQKSTSQTDSDLVEIKDLFEKGFRDLRQTFNAYPELLKDEISGDNLREKIRIYQKKVLRAESLPENFPLQEMMKKSEP